MNVIKNCVSVLWIIAASATPKDYSTCSSWDKLVGGKDFKYAPLVLISDPGKEEHPTYQHSGFIISIRLILPGNLH